MLGECVPIMVQLRVADTEADTYSTVRLLEMGQCWSLALWPSPPPLPSVDWQSLKPRCPCDSGCFESNPAEIEALDRLQEVSSVDRFWRSFQEAVALVAEDDPEARTPGQTRRRPSTPLGL